MLPVAKKKKNRTSTTFFSAVLQGSSAAWRNRHCSKKNIDTNSCWFEKNHAPVKYFSSGFINCISTSRNGRLLRHLCNFLIQKNLKMSLFETDAKSCWNMQSTNYSCIGQGNSSGLKILLPWKRILLCVSLKMCCLETKEHKSVCPVCHNFGGQLTKF